LVAVAYFLPGCAKDLAAPPRVGFKRMFMEEINIDYRPFLSQENVGSAVKVGDVL